MVPDIGHLKQTTVETGISQGLLKQGFMGARGTGRHHHTVQAVFLDLFGNLLLSVLRAAKKICVCKDNIV